MRHYSAADEENIRMETLLREWRRSGFIEASQTAGLESGLRTDLRRTNAFLRGLLFLFTTIIVLASVYLVFVIFHVEEKAGMAAVSIAAAAGCLGLAEALVRRFRLYRFGAEEALSSSAAVLLAIGAALISSEHSDNLRIFIVLVVGAIAALYLYVRFGYVYAAVAAI